MKQLTAKEIPQLREEILKLQSGVCPICEHEIDGDACLDHHHVKKVKGTGQIRGVLCRKCNVFIAKSENNCVRYGIDQSELPRILRNTAKYLEKTQYPYLHPSEAPKKPKLMKSSYNEMLRWHKKNGTARRVANFPKSGVLTKPLKKMFDMAGIEPKYYK